MSFSASLQTLPPGVSETLALIAKLDRCFVHGFAGRDAEHQSVLGALERVYSGTPLCNAIVEAAAALARSEYQERHFAVLAAARAALQGSLYDALRLQAQQALGRKILPFPSQTPTQPAVLLRASQVCLEAVRHWLMEVAMVGFARLDTGLLLPFLPTLEQVQADPLLVRQAALLTGTFHEWLNQAPVAQSSDVPAGRWADLWSRAMLGGMGNAGPDEAVSVTGTLTVLGLAIYQHAHMVSLSAHAVLETGSGEVRSVQLSRSAYKVDAIAGSEVWLLFADSALLFEALASRRGLAVDGAHLLPTGDLLWDAQGSLVAPVDPSQVAECYKHGASAPQSSPVAPFDRHPVQLAEPVSLENYTCREEEGRLWLDWANGDALPVATRRLGALSDIQPAEIAASSRLFGLLRFDAGHWAVQPLMLDIAKAKGKSVLLQNGQSALAVLKNPPKNSAVAQLQERAGRLLREH